MLRAVALFVVGCAVWFIAIDGRAEPDHVVLEGIDAMEPERTALDRALSGLESVQRARSALGQGNYGVASAEVHGLERQLTDLISQLAPRSENENP
jgi:hypothetical protein